jgi:hypothetical protein
MQKPLRALNRERGTELVISRLVGGKIDFGISRVLALACVGVVGPTRASTSSHNHPRVARFATRRRSRSHESPACKPIVRP